MAGSNRGKREEVWGPLHQQRDVLAVGGLAGQFGRAEERIATHRLHSAAVRQAILHHVIGSGAIEQQQRPSDRVDVDGRIVGGGTHDPVQLEVARRLRVAVQHVEFGAAERLGPERLRGHMLRWNG